MVTNYINYITFSTSKAEIELMILFFLTYLNLMPSKVPFFAEIRRKVEKIPK